MRCGLAVPRIASPSAAATLGLVAAFAEQQPVLLLLDDVQWFDVPSSEALRFMLRRLVADRVAAILAVREHTPSLLDGTEIATIHLEGLSTAEARAPARGHSGVGQQAAGRRHRRQPTGTTRADG